MSHQVYFLQSEEDLIQFLDYLEMLKSVIWTGKRIVPPNEVKHDIDLLVSSPLSKVILIPDSVLSSVKLREKEELKKVNGIEMLLCCKNNSLSRTYEVGRLYCAVNNDFCHSQLVEFYCTLKAFIIKNYYYSTNARVYFAPMFKRKYDAHYYFATQMGIPIKTEGRFSVLTTKLP